MTDVDIGRLKYSVIADDKESQSVLSKLTHSLFNLKTLLLGIASVAVWNNLIQGAHDFEVEISNIAAYGVENLNKLKNTITETGMAFGTSMTEQAKTFTTGLRAGIDEANIEEFMKTANKLAVAGATDLKVSIDLLDSVIDSYNMDVRDTEMIADKFYKAAKIGEVSMTELASGIGKIAPLAQEAGVSLDDMLAVITTMTAKGVPIQEAFMSFRTTLIELLTPSEDLKNLFNELGYETGQAAIESRGLSGVLQDVWWAVGQDKAAFEALFPSARQLPGLLKAISDGGKTLDTNLMNITESTGVLDEAFKLFKGASDALKLKEMGAQWNYIKTTLGEWATKIWTTVGGPILDTMVKIIDKLKEWWNIVADKLAPAFSKIKDIWYDAVYGENGIKATLEKGDITGAMTKTAKMISDMWDKVWNGGFDSGGHEYPGIKKIVGDAFGKIDWPSIQIDLVKWGGILGAALGSAMVNAMRGIVKWWWDDFKSTWSWVFSQMGKDVWKWMQELEKAIGKMPTATEIGQNIIGEFQFGGMVQRTGVYKLERGEEVIRASNNFTMGNINVNNYGQPISTNIANQVISEINTKMRRGEVIFSSKRGFIK
jgi:TP901 family phage tail tape measure protein